MIFPSQEPSFSESQKVGGSEVERPGCFFFAVLDHQKLQVYLYTFSEGINWTLPSFSKVEGSPRVNHLKKPNQNHRKLVKAYPKNPSETTES